MELLESLRATLERERSLTLPVRCHPGAKQSAITDLLNDGSVKISTRAPADDGRANKELCELLKESFPGASVSLVAGQTSRRKIVRISL